MQKASEQPRSETASTRKYRRRSVTMSTNCWLAFYSKSGCHSVKPRSTRVLPCLRRCLRPGTAAVATVPSQTPNVDGQTVSAWRWVSTVAVCVNASSLKSCRLCLLVLRRQLRPSVIICMFSSNVRNNHHAYAEQIIVYIFGIFTP